MKIAFVCTGNTCRSPMAEYFFRDLVEKKGLERNYEITSFGLGGFGGYEASVNSVAAMKEVGLDLSHHRSRTANPETLDQDIFLTMTRGHRDLLRQHFPQKPIFTLKEFGSIEEEVLRTLMLSYDDGEEPSYPVNEGEDIDVSDPYGGDMEEYRTIRDEITESLNSLLEKMESVRRVLEER